MGVNFLFIENTLSLIFVFSQIYLHFSRFAPFIVIIIILYLAEVDDYDKAMLNYIFKRVKFSCITS